MTGFEPQTSGEGSDRSTKCATTGHIVTCYKSEQNSYIDKP